MKPTERDFRVAEATRDAMRRDGLWVKPYRRDQLAEIIERLDEVDESRPVFDLGIVEQRCGDTTGFVRFECGCYRYLDRLEGSGDWARNRVFSVYSCGQVHASAWWGR